MVGGDPEWARELRKQLVLEIELVSTGLTEGVSLLHEQAIDAASERINDLRRRLEQVDRLIEAIESADRLNGGAARKRGIAD